MTLATKRKVLNVTRYAVLMLVALIMLYPLFWMISGIWKENHEIFTSASLIPNQVVDGWDSIVQGWRTRTGFTLGHYFLNTMRFLIPRVIAQVISCVLTAYAITRFNFKGKKLVFSLVIATLLMPEVIFRIPLFVMFGNMGLLGTMYPLWLEAAFATGSFFVFMLVQYIRTIPKELDEAAKIDGCNSLQTLILILVPCMKPVIITVGLLTFMWGMNDFIGPLIYIPSQADFSLAQGLRLARDNTGEGVIQREIFAMSVIALIPTITLFFSAQRFFIDGISSTGSKE